MKKVIIIIIGLILIGVGAYFIYQQFFATPGLPPAVPEMSTEPTAPSESDIAGKTNAQDFIGKATELFPLKEMLAQTKTVDQILKNLDYAARNLLPQLDRCDPAFIEMRNAVNAEVNISPADFSPTRKMPHFLTAQTMQKMLLVKGMGMENQGKLDKAVNNYLLAAQFGSVFAGKNTMLIQKLVGVASEKMAYKPLKHFVLNHPQETELMKKIIATLEKAEQNRVPLSEAMRSEQKCLETVVKNRAHYAQDTEIANLSELEVQQILRDTERVYGQLCMFSEMPHATLIRENIAVKFEEMKLNNELHPLVRSQMLQVIPPKVREGTTATDNRLIRVMAAIQLYHHDKNAYPNSLSELAPTYLTTVPKDYFSDSDFVYGVRDNSFYLYSVGPDMQDNQEQPVYDPTNGTNSVGDIIGR
jgi:hypothetical protein